VFVTRNQRLQHQRPLPLRGQLLASNDPVEQVHELVRALGLNPEARLFTRCVRCNLPLEQLEPDASRLDSLPPHIRSRYRLFYACPGCKTVFWKGTHATNTCRKLGLPDAAEVVDRSA
jgi:uncharacterized protein with PIN domain